MAMWRAMAAKDITAVCAVADVVHQDLPESAEVVSERLRLYPAGCLVLEEAGSIVGYAISHPIRPASPPQLNTLLREIPKDASEYYIHDVALLPHLRGSGMARAGIEALLAGAEGFPLVGLISVYGTGPFWSRFGFGPSGKDLGEKLAPYGEDAVYMVREAA